MHHDRLTPELRQSVRHRIEEEPNLMLGELARQLGVSEGAVASALSEDMRRFAPAERFEEIWDAMTGWEKVTFIVAAENAIVEVRGKLPKGRFGHGFFNLMDKNNPLGGHLRADQLRSVCFLSKPFFGLESHSVQFYDGEGRQMFAVHVGREGRELIGSVREAFFELRDAMAMEPALEEEL